MEAIDPECKTSHAPGAICDHRRVERQSHRFRGVEATRVRIPEVPALAGVVLMVYWSTICPTAACNFSLIDKTIEYWHARGKRVVLTVATNGFPIRVKSAGPGDIEGATPEWVMQQIKTYPFASRVLGGLPGEQDRVTQFPDFRDRK
jgi:hypothetical protein